MLEDDSWSSHFTLEEQLKAENPPQLSVDFQSGFRLRQISDVDSLQPYIKIQTEVQSLSTQIATELTPDHHSWKESLTLEITEGLYLILYDHDEYGEDECIACYYFDSSLFSRWKGRSEVWLRLVAARESINTHLQPQDIATTVTPAMFGESSDQCPMLHLSVEFSDSKSLNLITAEVLQHKTVIERNKSFTIYNILLVRLDGYRWNVPLRYSQVYNLRFDLVKVLPSLRDIPFSGKTYFHWLGFVCPGFSKFDNERIQRRKKSIQDFLNVVLENLEELQSDQLADLLSLP